MTVMGHIRCFLFGLSSAETTCARRGFRGATHEVQTRLDSVGAAFLAGYHSALGQDTTSGLVGELNQVELELRGFAFEGAGMALALLDGFTPWKRNRVKDFLQGPGDAHTYLIHVGVGWIWARIPFNLRPSQQHLDPLLRWLAFDGWGFNEGYFHWKEYAAGRPVPKQLSDAERRVFDQGLGRSFWFVNGGNPELIQQMIGGFSTERQPDMWSGIGLSASYAGIAVEADLRALRENAGQYGPQLAQGCAFAAKARQRAGNLTDYSELASTIFCRMSAEEAALLCDSALENLPDNASEPAFEIWRQRIQHHLKQHQRQPKLQEA